MKHARAGGALLLVFGLAACAVGPDYVPPFQELPQHYARDSKAVHPRSDLSQWWKTLRDPLLDALMVEAVSGNLDVASAKARIREARATQRIGIGGFFPLLDGGAAATQSKTSTAPDATSPTIWTHQAGFDASWELDLAGAQRRTVEAASYGSQAADEDLRATLLILIADVARNYVELRGIEARTALARRTAASQRETAGLTRSKFNAGSSSAVDLSKATAIAAGTEAEIPALETSRAAYIHRLGVLTGQQPGALIVRLRRSRGIPVPHMRVHAGFPADLLSRRADIAKAERQLAQATARIGVAEAALYPSVNLTGSLASSARNAGDLGRGSTIGWAWGPTLTVPMFAGGRLLAAVDVADAQRDQAHLALRTVVLTAMEDVENALIALHMGRIRVARLSEAVTSYRQAARLSRSLWSAGSSSFLEVLDAERSLYSAEDALLQTRIANVTSMIALAKALGGGWDAPVPVLQPVVVDGVRSPSFVPIPNQVVMP